MTEQRTTYKIAMARDNYTTPTATTHYRGQVITVIDYYETAKGHMADVALPDGTVIQVKTAEIEIY